jgi:hypothetical protein
MGKNVCRPGWTLLAIFACGCSGRPSRVDTPDVDAQDAAELALKELDRDGDAALNADELKACPSLVNAMPMYDSDKDGALSQAELVAGIESWSKRGVGGIPLPFTVRLDGRPLVGAQVKLTPLPFLGDAVKPAFGEADGSGSGSLNMAAEDRPSHLPKNLPLVQPGLFSVEVTHPTVKVPAKFNTATTLGLETAIAGQSPAGVTWDLSSR